MWRLPAVVVFSVGLLSGCGSSEPEATAQSRTEPVAEFAPAPTGERVFAAYRQSGSFAEKVSFPSGTREIGVLLDCAGSSGTLEVVFSKSGTASFDCEADTSEDGGIVILAGEGAPELEQEMTINSSSGRWSVAVDAGEKLTG